MVKKNLIIIILMIILIFVSSAYAIFSDYYQYYSYASGYNYSYQNNSHDGNLNFFNYNDYKDECVTLDQIESKIVGVIF